MTKTKLTLKDRKFKSVKKIRPISRYCWKCDTMRDFRFYEVKGKREIYLCEICSVSYDVTVG